MSQKDTELRPMRRLLQQHQAAETAIMGAPPAAFPQRPGVPASTQEVRMSPVLYRRGGTDTHDENIWFLESLQDADNEPLPRVSLSKGLLRAPHQSSLQGGPLEYTKRPPNCAWSVGHLSSRAGNATASSTWQKGSKVLREED